MLHHLIRVLPIVPGRGVATSALDGSAGQPAHTPVTQSQDTAGTKSMQGVFHQLAQALTVLSREAELMLDSEASESKAQPIRLWLQPNARQAEAAMHQLREMRLGQIPAATELSQSLTVLVLAADMLVQGHLSDESALDTYGLLRRNAERAMQSLCELRAHVGLGVPQG